MSTNVEKYKNKGAFSPVYIGKDSFIGAGAIVLSGTKIGCNCIIGAGVVVKCDIPDYSRVIGNPCQIIGTTNSNMHHIEASR